MELSRSCFCILLTVSVSMVMAPTSCLVVACAGPASPPGTGLATVSAGTASDLSLGALLDGMFAGKLHRQRRSFTDSSAAESAGEDMLRTARHTAPRKKSVSKLCCAYIWHTADAALTCRSGRVVPTRHKNCLCMDIDFSYCPLCNNFKNCTQQSVRAKSNTRCCAPFGRGADAMCSMLGVDCLQCL